MKKRICKIMLILGMLVFCVGCGKNGDVSSQEKEYAAENEESADLENTNSTDGETENDELAVDETEKGKLKDGEDKSDEDENNEEKDIEIENEKEERIVLDAPTYIDASFVEMLRDLLQKENEEINKVLQSKVCDKVVTDVELENYAVNPDVAECKERMDSANGGMFLLIDGDNDGYDDLFAWIYDGGSMGNSHRVFLQGQKDGSFKKTYENEGITQELCFVEYDHKNYLIETSFDYNKKCSDGFILSCYEKGELYEKAYINKVVDSYVPEIAFVEDGYDKLAKSTAELGKKGFIKEDSYYFEWLVLEGSGEEIVATPEELKDEVSTKTVFCSDLNNDGQTEWYSKYIFYPSSMSTIVYLEDKLFFSDKQEKDMLLYHYDLEYDGIPLMYWVEHVEEEDRQIVCLLCYKGLSKNMVYGYLIEEENVSKVMEIDYEGEEKIVSEIYTKDINL